MSQAHQEPRIFQPGDSFRNYVVVSFIGAGACGQVYEVEHRHTLDHFALKVGHLKDRADAKKITRSLIEAKAVYKLEHPNIVKVIDLSCEDDGTVWHIMELLQGQPVGRLLAGHGRLSPLYAIEIALEAAFGLQAAHDAQIIHRDVHPWNIFVTSRGKVILLDFSLAKVIPSGLQTTAGRRGVGTAGYLALEQLKGAAPSPQFDVFALGTTLWEMLVGRHPLAAFMGNPMLLVKAQFEQEPESLVTAAGLPAYCDEVLRRAMARDPRDRYDGMWPFAQALRTLYDRLSTDPAAPPCVWEIPAWEQQYALGQDPESRSQYRPPRSLPRGSPAPPVPSARIVVTPAAGVAAPPLVARRPLAATVPMPVMVDRPASPPPPPAAEIAPATVRGRARTASRRRLWAALAAAPVLAGLGVGLWLLLTPDAPAAPVSAAARPVPRPPAASATAVAPRAPAPRSKR